MLKFKELYNNKIRADLQQEFNYSNSMRIPKLLKVCINMGFGEAVNDSKIPAAAVNDLGLITGQKPVLTLAKKSISTFKLRESMPIGCMVTLRKERMYEFLERLIIIALPRLRDFRGFSRKSFDKNGNFSFGLKDQIIFPEINYDRIYKSFGMDITLVTNAKNNFEAERLLQGFNVPFLKN